MIPLRSHIPHVSNVSSAHSGSRVASFISQPVPALLNYANLPNKGSLLSDVRPWSKNAGNHSIFAFPQQDQVLVVPRRFRIVVGTVNVVLG